MKTTQQILWSAYDDDNQVLNVGITAESIDLDIEGPVAEGAGISGNPVQAGWRSADFDGAAFPSPVTGDDKVAMPRATEFGVPYAMLVNEDGSATPLIAHDTAIGTGLGDEGMMQVLEAKDFDGSALPNAVVEGDAVRTAASLAGVTYNTMVSPDGSETPIVADDDAISAANGGTLGLMFMGQARDAQRTAVAQDDGVRPAFSLYGESILRSHTYASQSDRGEEVDPLDEHYVEEELIDDTNLGAATNYYPSSSGRALGNFNNVSIHGVTSGGVTFTVEGKIDDSTDWVDITPAGYRLDDNTTGNASFVDQTFMFDFDNLHVRTVRIKSVTSDGSNGVQYHWKLTSI